MGVYIDPVTNFMYSIGEDKKFKCYDVNRNVVLADLVASLTLLTGLKVDPETRRAFLTNRNGQLFIYDIQQKEPKLIHQYQAHPKNSAIRGLHFDMLRNYFFTSNFNDGSISIHDLGKPGKEKYMSTTASLQGKKEV